MRTDRKPARLSRLITLLLATSAVVACARAAFAEEPDRELGVRVPEGFEVTLYADDDLAHDIYSLTIDPLGRPVVSGAGYIKILVDGDGDGRAERAVLYADGPKSGAQGLYFDGRRLYCTGDAGLIRYTDENSDDRADGPPATLLKIKTGSEHHAHALRRGPDGWWYLIAGNNAGVDRSYARLETTPIDDPQAGTILRLKPDCSSGEVIADGFRNPYDFDFNAQGNLFAWDSDGERDVSLPWYQPTRVFHALPGSHAGWISRSWKRPGDFLDMPPVIGAFGRGSPTGVVCYRHRQFPERFQGALFILDWTFGRVISLLLEREGSTWTAEPVEFMTGVGQHGFAPTDAAVGPDGSLYVSVGGRGTRGGVYRIRWAGAGAASPSRGTDAAGLPPDDTLLGKLDRCLNAPQPLSSWSRAEWMPLARELGRAHFMEAARDERRTAAARLRAVEIVTELFGGLDAAALFELAASNSAEVRARAVWSHGRAYGEKPVARAVNVYLSDSDPLVSRTALEALMGAGPDTDWEQLLPALCEQLAGPHRFNRQMAGRAASRLDQEMYDKLAALAREKGRQALVSLSFGAVRRELEFEPNALETGLQTLESDDPRELKLEGLRLMQLALGDVGSNGNLDPVFDGYAAQIDLSSHGDTLSPLSARLAARFPSGDERLDREAARVLAMLEPSDESLLDRLLAKIGPQSHPVDDIHYLIAAARVPAARSPARNQRIAEAFIALERKIVERGLNRDSNWDDRVGEAFARHIQLSPELARDLVSEPSFGRPGHVYYLRHVPKELLPQAIAAFVRQIERDDDYAWTPGTVFVVGESPEPQHRALVRGQLDNLAVRDAALTVLAERPAAADRPHYVEGLESSSLDVLSACLSALEALPADASADEQFALLALLVRLGREQAELGLKERAARLLARNTEQNFGPEKADDAVAVREAADAWSRWLRERYPDEAARKLQSAEAELTALKAMMAEVDWSGGDVERGRKVFETRSCARCHGDRQALGPDLAGAAGRFSRDDLFTAIAAPNRDVSTRYQTTLVQTKRGKVYTGLIVYESVDGLLLRDANGRTFRIEGKDIALRKTMTTSLMPAGLLKDAAHSDLADLYAYLKALAQTRTADKDAAKSE
ncbi:MAG: c-type cytochrome [Planctomycetes bacterium]|nr:c-type cytochrome [Planctomycetota bacterium]